MKDQIARFEAPTMNEALKKIRSVFGEDGMIVGTRTFKRRGWLGVRGREVVEVFVTDTRARIENVRRQTLNRGRDTDTATVEPKRQQHAGFDIITDTLAQIRVEIQDLLSRSPERPGFSHPFLKECYDLLVLRELDPRVADSLVREIANLRIPSGYPTPARVQAIVHNQLAKLFIPNPPVDPDVVPRVISLVGPTGVGKTTTIAKLAARARINEGRNVGLITLDTFRIAAVDQLQKYADIIGVPLQVVSDPAELKAAVVACREQGLGLVFVDTAGRSHRDELRMAEIREFLTAIPEAEVHLVLSCTTHSRTIESVAEQFSSVDYQRLVLTKIDETVSLGALVASLIKIGKPVSYVTDGQNVPDDIMVGDPDRLADLVLKSQG